MKFTQTAHPTKSTSSAVLDQRLNRAEMEARRMHALELFRGGATQAEVARALCVSRTAASRWARLAETPDALKRRKAPGRPPRTSTEQLARICAPDEKWTGAAFGRAVLKTTGVDYSPDHTYRLLERARKAGA